jgi:predicted DNA-binding transcriptional regulator AlpA
MNKPITPAGGGASQLERLRHLTSEQVCNLRGIQRAKLWRDVKECRFPAPLRMGTRCTRWLAGPVIDFLQDPEGWVRNNRESLRDAAEDVKHERARELVAAAAGELEHV